MGCLFDLLLNHWLIDSIQPSTGLIQANQGEKLAGENGRFQIFEATKR